MPSFEDFQLLVDWCTQPSPDYHLQRLVRAELVQSNDTFNSYWEGDLVYRPPRAGLPEFRGQLTRAADTVAVAMFLASKEALADFTWANRWYELTVISVDAQGSEPFLHQVDFGSVGNTGNTMTMYLWGSYRYMHQ